MSENTETVESTEEQKKITLLESWRELLKSIESSREDRITPQVANKVVTAWPKLGFTDVVPYFAVYHDYLTEMREILLAELESHPEALTKKGDEDGAENAEQYLNILFQWQAQAIVWEAEWDVTAPDAAIRLAAIADATNFYLGQMGLVAHLGQIGFDYDEADEEALREALQEFKEDL